MYFLNSFRSRGGGAILTTATLLLLLPGAMLAKKYPLTSSSIVPAATGELSTDTDNNGNVRIKIKVKHLADPKSLTPAKNSYVIWIEPNAQAPQNCGTLRVNGKLEGQFQTTTPYTSFDVVITAEDDPSTKAPSGPEVLKASIRP